MMFYFKKDHKSLTLFMVITLIMALALAGCSSSSNSSNSGNAATAVDGGEKKADPIIVKFSHVTTIDSPKGLASEKFKELAEKYTDGRVTVEVYPSSQLYGDKEELEAVQAGNVHIIAPSITKLVGMNPQFQYVDLPFLFKDNEAVYKFWESDANKKLMNSLDNYGVRLLAMWPNGFKQFVNGKYPLVTPADFKGLKFRVQAGSVLEAQFKALGAGSATIPFGETYTALQQGTVDATENTFNNIDTQKYAEVQKHLTVSNHGRLDYCIIVNTKFWDGLPGDIREALEKAMAEATDYAVELAEDLDQKSFENLKNAGMEVVELNEVQRAEFVKVMEPVVAEFESVIGKDIIDAARAANQ
ncbi:TRAP transporter substrate-binding protein [Desulfitobacterium hafniense]|uniref:TRAP transporter substrate-binding protein n=1 Tax=Desulfitobacterium hafniense TaxID=49338 RepID=UPI00037D6351|nr:TRAP transporter substrate-binding protein [Desulfitobacterium hafniense]